METLVLNTGRKKVIFDHNADECVCNGDLRGSARSVESKKSEAIDDTPTVIDVCGFCLADNLPMSISYPEIVCVVVCASCRFMVRTQSPRAFGQRVGARRESGEFENIEMF